MVNSFWHLTQPEQNHNYLLAPWMTTFYSNPWAIDQLWHLQSCAATIQPLQLHENTAFIPLLLRSAVLSPPRRWCVTGYYITAEADFHVTDSDTLTASQKSRDSDNKAKKVRVTKMSDTVQWDCASVAARVSVHEWQTGCVCKG